MPGRGLALQKPLPQAGRLLFTVLIIILAAQPAWTGDYVYDDLLMRQNEAMDGFEDVLLSFRRTSSDYFQQPGYNGTSGATYRPLAHVTLIGVHVLGSSPLAHHLVSLGLHIASVVLLFRVACRYAHPTLAWLLSAFFGAHPLSIEAYGWINGRADLLAGVMLLGLALALACARDAPAGPVQLLASAASAMAAVLAKETAAIAVLALAVAQLFPAQGLPSKVEVLRRASTLVASLLGVVLSLVLRAMLVGIHGSGQAALQAQSNGVVSLGRLYAKALTSALVPVPRTMTTLAWELSRPLEVAEIVLLVLAGSVLLAMAVRGHWRTTILFVGAAATLAPAVLVSSAFWCGFDRYLYMPAILVALGIAATPAAYTRRFGTRALLAAAACMAVVLGWATFYTAQNYHSHAAFIGSMIQLRPEDPSGYLFGAQWLAEAGQRDEARQLLASVPREGLPRPLASALVTRLASVSQRDEAIAVLEDMVERYPDDPYAVYDLVGTSIQRGDLSRAFAAAERLRPLVGFCDGVQVLLADALRRPTISRQQIEDFRRSYSCD